MLSELWSDLRYRLRALFHRSSVEAELEQELRFHLEREAEKLRGAGVPAGEAMRQARLAFGGVEQVKEISRDGRGIAWLETANRDLRYAVRSLARNPGFATAVILTLGLGIGANAAMFGIVDRLLFRAPPYLTQPDRVHRVYLASQGRTRKYVGSYLQYTRYADLKRWTTAFSQAAGFTGRSLAVGTGQDAREMQVALVSASFFDFFDAQPALGRFFLAQEDTVPAGAMVAVLSYAFWETQYGSRPEVLGQQLQVGPTSYSIIGVAPRDFVGVADEGPPAVFVPITAYAATARSDQDRTTYYTEYHWSWMQMMVRRKPGVSVETATADLTNAYRRSWDAESALAPGDIPARTISQPHGIAAPILQERGPNQSTVTKVAGWVSGVAGIVLLIACANVANLLLARAFRRRREIALRLALGAGRRRLVAQLLTETLLLAGLGAVAGLLLAHWGGAVLRARFLPDAAPGSPLADGRTLGFAFAVTLIAGLLTGLAPVLQARRADLVESLKAGAREGGYRRSPTRTALLLLQGTLSVVLLVGAGLFLRSLENVRGLRLGYDVDPILYVSPNFRGVRLKDEERIALTGRLLDEARTLPGVEGASLGLTVPFWDTWSEDLRVPGIDSVSRLGEFTLQAGSPEYFATIGTRIIKGRGFTADDRKDTPPVVLVSETMAKTLWPGQDALGKCMRMNSDTVPCMTVIGVTEGIRQSSLTDAGEMQYYLPLEQYHRQDAALFIRTRGDAEELKETVRRRLQPLMPGAAYVNVTPMHDIIDPNVRSWQLGATMFLAFGGLALLLAAIGLYSVIAYDVVQRTHELGIRIALGARSGDVVRLVVRDGLRFGLIGVSLGGAIALAAGRWIAPLLFAESPRDPLVFGTVTALLLGVAAVASALPAARAARVDPNVALRGE